MIPDMANQRFHSRNPRLAQFSDDRFKPIKRFGMQRAQHMPVKRELRKIDIMIDGLQNRGCPQKSIIAARMHRIKAIGQVLCAHDLQDRQFRLIADIKNGAVFHKDINAPVHTAKIDAGLAHGLFHQARKGPFDEFPICLGPANKTDIGHIQPLARPAKQHARPIVAAGRIRQFIVFYRLLLH